MLHRFIGSCAGIALLAFALQPSPCRDSDFVLRAEPGEATRCILAEGQQKTTADFVLRAEPSEALAGGPVIVKLTLEYQGAKPAVVHGSITLAELIDVTAPKGWVKPDKPKYEMHPPSLILAAKQFKRGDKFSHYLYLHHLYEKIPAGKAILIFEWCLAKPKPNGFAGELLAELKAECPIDVLPGTAENLKAARQRILDDILDEDPTGEKTVKLVHQLIWTDHPKTFVPLCFRYLILHPPLYSLQVRHMVLDYLLDCEKCMPEVRAQLIDYLVKHGSVETAGWVLGGWRNNRVQLTKQEVARLMEARDLGVRAITARVHPDKVSERTKQRLLEQIDEVRKMVTEKPPGFDRNLVP